MKKKLNVLNIVAILLSIFVIVFFLSSKADAISNPVELYRVYLSGETIGYIKDKKELEKHINDSQNEIKEKYNIENVFLPHELDIVKEITYNKVPLSINEMYDKIVSISDFTVEGYTITIKKDEKSEDKNDLKIYVLDKKLFEESMESIVKIFVDEKGYKEFLKRQEQEETVKKDEDLIEDIYIKNHISIKKGNISTKNNIFTDSTELNRYLLYGDNVPEVKYTVRRGDSIADVAFNNKLSVEEFLIVNKNFSSENNLLSEGQRVNVGLPKPIVDVVEEEHIIQFQNIGYETKITYDEAYTVGYSRVAQNGENGKMKLTVKRQKVNGQITSFIIANKETIKEAIPRIVVRGGRKVPTIGELGIWRWPTEKPSQITSGFGWRWGKFHTAIDISGPGCGSTVYATNNGVVDTAALIKNRDPFTSTNGNYIYIDHNNGYFSEYAHLQKVYVQEGQMVEMGQAIGQMGNTGYSFGCHLHFGIARGKPGKTGTQYVNPLHLVVY